MPGRARLTGLVALALVPLAVATARVGRSWVAVSDQAGIVLRTRDVFTFETPLVGMPTTLGDGLGATVHHPGPVWFWPAAVAQAVVDHHASPMFATVVLNAVAVVAVVVLARRVGGWPAAALAAAFVAASCWSLHEEMLTDPYNPYAGHLPLAAFLVALVALGRGVAWALPVVVVAGTIAVQSHVSLAAPVAGALVVGGLAWVGLGAKGDRIGQLRTFLARERGAVIGALVAAAVCWAPVAVDLVAGRHNLWNLARASASDGEALGVSGSARVIARALAHPAWLTDERTVSEVLAPVGTGTWVVAGLVVGTALVVAWRARRSHPGIAVALAVSLGALAAGALAMARIPVGFWTLYTLHNYLWLWATTALLGAALVAALGLAVIERMPRRPPWSVGVSAGAVGVAVVAGLVVAALAVADPSGRPTWSSQYGPAVVALGGGADELDPGATYELVVSPLPLESIVPLGVLVELERAGVNVRVEERLGDMVGEHRVVDGPVAGRLVVRSGEQAESPIPGSRRIATFEASPEAVARLDAARAAVVAAVEDGGGLVIDDPAWPSVSPSDLEHLVDSGALISYWELGLVRSPDLPASLLVELRRAHHAPVVDYALDLEVSSR